MDIADAFVTLAAVVVGGAIAALTGRGEARREGRVDALRAVGEMYCLAIARPSSPDEFPTDHEVLGYRLALLQGGVPWTFVELIESAVRASLYASWYIGKFAANEPANEEEEKRQERAKALLGSPRFLARPTLEWTRLLGEVVRQELEQPLRARTLRPLVRYRLRRALATLQTKSEIADLVLDRKDPHDQVAYMAVHAHLEWPARNAEPLRRYSFSVTHGAD